MENLSKTMKSFTNIDNQGAVTLLITWGKLRFKGILGNYPKNYVDNYQTK